MKPYEVTVRKHDREIEQRERHCGGTQASSRSIARAPAASCISGTCRSVNDSASKPGIMISGDHCRPIDADERREQHRREGEPERAARKVRGHREALAVIGDLVNQRRRRRMECGAAESADHEDHTERERRVRQPMKPRTTDRHERSRHHQHSRAPAIGERAETELRHRVGHLETHRQRARRRIRQAERRHQQRQQRRVDVRYRRRPRRAWTRPSRSTGEGRASRVRGGFRSTGHPLEAPDDEVAGFTELRDPQQLCRRHQRGERQHDGDEQA